MLVVKNAPEEDVIENIEEVFSTIAETYKEKAVPWMVDGLK